MLLVSGCSIELQHDLTEQDANEIYVLLEQNGISPLKKKEEGGNEPRYQIVVPKADASASARLLREYSLPRTRFGALEAIQKGKGMIPTQVEERAIMLLGIGGEIANALNLVDGVLDARTVVSIPQHNDLTQPDKKPIPSASVFLKYRLNPDGKAPLNETQVKAFVAAAVEELKPENVNVIMTQAVLPDAMTLPADQQLVDVLGIRVTRATAGQLKAMLAIGGLLILSLVAFTTWTFMRSSGGGIRPRRPRPEAGG
ncbi:MAG TPA: type III secretion protein [Myxococcales bacterium]|nr:type III secretion protein [Myxococcales bacterium]